MGLKLASPWPRVVSVLHYIRVRPPSPLGEEHFLFHKQIRIENNLYFFKRLHGGFSHADIIVHHPHLHYTYAKWQDRLSHYINIHII